MPEELHFSRLLTCEDSQVNWCHDFLQLSCCMERGHLQTLYIILEPFFFHRRSTCLVHKITIVVLIQISAKKTHEMKRCVLNKWLFQHQILRINIEKNPAKLFAILTKRGPASPLTSLHLQKPHLFENRLFGGPIDPWQEVRQASVEADALEVPRNTGRLKLEVSATEIFREKQFPWGWTEPTAKTTCRFQQLCNFEKNIEKQKTLHFQQLVAGTKSYFQLLPKIKNTGKTWHVPGVGKCIHPLEVTVLREAGRAQESGGWVWRFGGAVKLKGKRLSQIAVEEGKIAMKDGKKRQLLETHSG